MSVSARSALAPGTVLAAQVRIVAVVEEDALGLGYAVEVGAERTPARLHELLPVGLVVREATGAVALADPAKAEVWKLCLESYARDVEARRKSPHANVQAVRAIFASHGTVCSLLAPEQGRALGAVAQDLARRPRQDELDKVVAPLVAALTYLHGLGQLHANVSPDTVLLSRELQPLLTRIGGTLAKLSAAARSLQPVLSAGYSAPELYAFDKSSLGPACDVFSLAAVLYRLVTGVAPADVVARGLGAPMPSARQIGGDYRQGFLHAIDAGLSLDPASRPASIDVMGRLLLGTATPAEQASIAGPAASQVRAGAPRPADPPLAVPPATPPATPPAPVPAAPVPAAAVPSPIRPAPPPTPATPSAQPTPPSSPPAPVAAAASRAPAPRPPQQPTFDKPQPVAANAAPPTAPKVPASAAATTQPSLATVEPKAPEPRQPTAAPSRSAPSGTPTAPATPTPATPKLATPTLASPAPATSPPPAPATPIAKSKPLAGSLPPSASVSATAAPRLGGASARLAFLGLALIAVLVGAMLALDARLRQESAQAPVATAPPAPKAPPVAASAPTAPAPTPPPPPAATENDRQKSEASARAAADRQRDEARADRLAAIARATERDVILSYRAEDAALAPRAEARLTALGFVRIALPAGEVWRRPGDGEPFRDCENCPELVLIPGATAGAPPTAVGRYKVTREEFAAYVTQSGREPARGCHVRDPDWQLDPALSWREPGFQQSARHPAVCLNLEDANAYLAWLGQRAGRAYRMLEEREWMQAAAAGAPATQRFAFGDDEREICAYGNGADASARSANVAGEVAGCSDGHVHTSPVGAFRPNRYGLYDMLGNAWEWVATCVKPVATAGEASSGDGTVPCTTDSLRLLKGGSWLDRPEMLRLAARLAAPPDVRDQIAGFRVARPLTESGSGAAAGATR